MSEQTKPLTRSTSRSKRSTTNLANLRLAPLSAKYTEQPIDRHAPKSPYEEAAEATLAKYTYRQGRSAPSTPGISPGAVRRRSGGGLSRRESVYDEELSEAVRDYARAKADNDSSSSFRSSIGDAGLLMTPSVVVEGDGSTKKASKHKRSRTVGTNTPRSKSKSRIDDDWLSHTGATANAMLLESKGATWLSSRPSATNLVIADDSDDDEGYEEMAALSATTTRNDVDTAVTDGNKTPRQWGSRFGSRPASRHASRRGSIAAAGAMTPRGNPDALKGYFENQANLQLVDDSGDDTDDDNEHLAELTKDKSFGLGPYVDKIMYSIFSLPDAEESGAETSHETETVAEAKARRARDAQRRQQEKDRLVAPAAPEPGSDGQKVGLWEDANWLFNVATRALT